MDFSIGDRVRCLGVDLCGIVTNVRKDSSGNKIYDVLLDNPTATPTGHCVARDFELRKENI